MEKNDISQLGQGVKGRPDTSGSLPVSILGHGEPTDVEGDNPGCRYAFIAVVELRVKVLKVREFGLSTLGTWGVTTLSPGKVGPDVGRIEGASRRCWSGGCQVRPRGGPRRVILWRLVGSEVVVRGPGVFPKAAIGGSII